VTTEVGPVEIDVPRDRNGSFEPELVQKRQRRLTGVDEMVLSLSAKGLTHGEISAHLAEVYGAQVSKQTISTITDSVLERMAEWQNRPLDRLYPVVFIDCVSVKIGDGQVANRPVYMAFAVTAEGPATSSASGSVTVVRAPSTGSTSSPRSRTGASRMSSWWSATGSGNFPSS
jgi:transposase-like protein